MLIGYIEDAPEDAPAGKKFAIVFTRGCNMRCGYCSSAELLTLCDEMDSHEWDYARDYLVRNADNLDGVLLSGGEPTIHEDLEERLVEIRAMGLQVHLETNGSNPELLRSLFSRGLIDFVAMDVKAPLENYLGVVGRRVDTEAIRNSIWIIKQSGVSHEFRTTVVPGLHTAREIKLIAELVHGAQCYVVQDFISEKPLRQELRDRPAFPHKPLEEIRAFVERRVQRYEIRHSPEAKPMPILRRRLRSAVIGV